MNYAEQLKEQLRQRREAEPTFDVELPVPELGPDFIFKFKARRVQIAQVIMTGQIPEHIAIIFLNAARSGGDKAEQAAKVATQMSGQDQIDFIRMQRRVVIDLCADPVLVEKYEEAEGEVSIFKLPVELMQALYLYSMAMAPDIPVETLNGGSVLVADIESFRPEESNP